MKAKIDKPNKNKRLVDHKEFYGSSNRGSMSQFADMRSETIVQRKLQMMADEYTGTKNVLTKQPLIQRYVLDEKTHYRLDKFNSSGERAQVIAGGIYTHLFRLGLDLKSFDYLYDEVLNVLESFGINKLIEDDDAETLLSTVVEKLLSGEWLINNVIEQLGIQLNEDEKLQFYHQLKKQNFFNLNPDRVLLELNIMINDNIPIVKNSEADEILDYKSTEKEFIKTESGQIIAYPKGKDSLLFEAWLYKRIQQKTKDFENKLILPNPELVYNVDRRVHGIKMNEIEGKNIDVYMRGFEEIRLMIISAAENFKIENTKKEQWVNDALERIKAIILELKENKISIYDLQGILDKNGIWTIIDPRNVVKKDQ